MKTATVRCGECGSLHEKEIFDLDLEVGDVVREILSALYDLGAGATFVVEQVHETDRWLGWGRNREPYSWRPGETLHDIRIDTRNYRYEIVSRAKEVNADDPSRTFLDARRGTR
jgi:hypothetical protein